MTDIPKVSVVDSEPSALRWTFINEWKVEPQSDDRPPMIAKVGAVAVSTASSAASRSSARRKHQVMFKEWSQNRHE